MLMGMHLHFGDIQRYETILNYIYELNFFGSNRRFRIVSQLDQTDDNVENAEALSATAIVRDVTFSRASADRGILLHLGKDVEIAWLQLSPILTAMHDKGHLEGLDMQPNFTEVVRLRMPWHSVMEFAIHTLQVGVEKKIINLEKLIEVVGAMDNISGQEIPEGDAS